MRKMNILNNEKDKKEFNNAFFTEKGYDTILNYGKTLAKFYFTQKVYPFKMGMVFGIPFFKFANEVRSKEELAGRIKLIMRLTGQTELKVKLGDSEVSLKFEDD